MQPIPHVEFVYSHHTGIPGYRLTRQHWLWFEHEDPRQREIPHSPQYIIDRDDVEGGITTLLETDDAAEAYAFALAIAEEE